LRLDGNKGESSQTWTANYDGCIGDRLQRITFRQVTARNIQRRRHQLADLHAVLARIDTSPRSHRARAPPRLRLTRSLIRPRNPWSAVTGSGSVLFWGVKWGLAVFYQKNFRERNYIEPSAGIRNFHGHHDNRQHPFETMRFAPSGEVGIRSAKSESGVSGKIGKESRRTRFGGPRGREEREKAVRNRAAGADAGDRPIVRKKFARCMESVQGIGIRDRDMRSGADNPDGQSPL